MMRRANALRGVAPLALLLAVLAVLSSGLGLAPAQTKPGDRAPSKKLAAAGVRDFTTETVRGRVVWVEDALARRYGVATDPSAAEMSVVLETVEGRLLPIIPDVRGRAFAVDSRLRNIDLQLLVRRYEGVPMIQTIRVFRPKPDGLYEIDYWCDICAIPMFILKDCECCQGPTRLRERRVDGGEFSVQP